MGRQAGEAARRRGGQAQDGPAASRPPAGPPLWSGSPGLPAALSIPCRSVTCDGYIEAYFCASVSCRTITITRTCYATLHPIQESCLDNISEKGNRCEGRPNRDRSLLGPLGHGPPPRAMCLFLAVFVRRQEREPASHVISESDAGNPVRKSWTQTMEVQDSWLLSRL